MLDSFEISKSSLKDLLEKDERVKLLYDSVEKLSIESGQMVTMRRSATEMEDWMKIRLLRVQFQLFTMVSEFEHWKQIASLKERYHAYVKEYEFIKEYERLEKAKKGI